MAENAQMEEKKGISIPLIIVLVLIIGGGLFYFTRGEKVSVEVTEEVGTTTAPVAVELPVAAERAAKILAGGVGAPVETVKIIDAVEKEWPDACLGLAKVDEVCAQVLTSGYEIHLEAQSVKYTYRADKTGNVIRIDASMTGK